MVKIWGQKPNRKLVKQMATKKSQVTKTRPVLRHWCPVWRMQAAEWSWIWPSVLGLLRQITYELILADHEHFKSLAWPCMITRWHHWHHKRSHVPLVSLSVWPSSCLNFDPGMSPSNSTEKNPLDQGLWFWSAVFLSLLAHDMYWLYYRIHCIDWYMYVKGKPDSEAILKLAWRSALHRETDDSKRSRVACLAFDASATH